MPQLVFPHNSRNKIHEIIRVNHAGEFAANQIYKAQIRYTKNPQHKALLELMLNHESEHLDYFTNQMINQEVRPSLLLPIWQAASYTIGAISAKINLKAAMLITEGVEEVIEHHYQEQINYLAESDPDNPMLLNIKNFQQDEAGHRNTAITYNNKNNSVTNIVKQGVKTLCKIAIFLSKKI